VQRFHRREVMQMLGASLALAACSRGSSERGAAPTKAPPTTTAPPTTAPFDRSVPWWLQGNFAPVTEEVEAVELSVRGALPPELSGLYARNGSNPRTGESPHWFLGDGMVHGVRLERGRATWYGNRWVRTPLYEASVGFGDGVPGGTTTQSNVSLFTHGGRLLSSGEIGFPYELSPDDLSTVGPHDFGGRLTTSMTAHPKIDPATGRLHFFGYGFTPPFLTYHVAGADGTLVSSTEIPVPGPTMIHDFAITDRDAVFWDLPCVFDLEAAIAMVEGRSGAFPFRWDPEYGARVGVLPLGGDGAETRWFDVDPCYVFHGVNAFRRGDEVVLDVCRLASVFSGDEETLGGDLSLRRWTVDTATGKVTDDVLEEDDPGELPNRDGRRVGREHRYGYLVQARDRPDTVDLGGLIKHDFRSGRREVWDPGPHVHSGEWLFVPAPDGPADGSDDEGWLLAFVHDEATSTSSLAVVDATDVAAGPVATVELPQRVPYGFHGTWVPA
jgi:carotenoid cleavage dioxygenase-like enzyme